MLHRRAALAVMSAIALAMTAACTSNGATGPKTTGETISVSSTDDGCAVSADTAPSGNLVFSVTNDGDQVTEFYLYGEDGRRIVGEVENIGPGLSRDLVLKAAPGQYVAACKPGMTGDGIRQPFTVTDSGDDPAATGADQELIDAANARYAAYVTDEAHQLLSGTRRFVDAYKAGDDEAARRLYPTTRVHWERIEPVAESFGDLDPKMDLRQADLEPGQEWTGWHLLEKDLWPPRAGAYEPLSRADRARYADRLLADTVELQDRVAETTFAVDQIGNGAKSLLDEVAKGKITGEEEIWSHTDLYDFQANVDGARVAFDGLRPVLATKDPDLEAELEHRFDVLQRLLDRHRVGEERFESYTRLGTAQIKALSDAVNALSEPLSHLTAAVTL